MKKNKISIKEIKSKIINKIIHSNAYQLTLINSNK